MNENIEVLISYLQSDPEPSIVLDTNYTILGANQAYLMAYGDPLGSKTVGQKCYAVSHGYDQPCDLSGEHCPMAESRKTKARSHILHIHHTPNGKAHVDVELRPILDKHQKITAFVERISTPDTASENVSKDDLTGAAPIFLRALSDLQRVAKTDLPVLLQGETGTGKELFAKALHEASPRKNSPFVVVDCTGFSDGLFESELFGYEKGAFTGAHQAKAGLVETAEGGTLFLDEIGDIPLSMQVRLLRLLESGTFRRVGGLEPRRTDFRLVAATHKPLRKMAADGEFRSDLYYRVCVFPIHLPSLRERVVDMPLLVQTLLRRQAGGVAVKTPEVTRSAMQALMTYSWPGNVRQLKNVLDRASVLADDGRIDLLHLPDEVVKCKTEAGEMADVLGQISECRFEGSAQPGRNDLGMVIPVNPRKLDVNKLKALEQRFSGSRSALASYLGISERTLYRKLSGK